MRKSGSPQAEAPFADCKAKHLCEDLHCCETKRVGCSYGLSYGYELFCRHPDRKSWCVQPAVADSLNNRPNVPQEGV